MSEQVEITQEVTVDVCVYEVKCECGASLIYEAEVDSSQDVIVTVEEHKCLQPGDDK